MTYDNKQFVNEINNFWTKEIKKCVANVTVLRVIHKRVQRLYDIQQAMVRGETTLGRKLIEGLDPQLKAVIPEDVKEYVKSMRSTGVIVIEE